MKSVLVIVSTSTGFEPLVRWGARFARARGHALCICRLIRGPARQPVVIDLEAEGEDDDESLRALRWVSREVSEPGEAPSIRNVSSPDPLRAVLEEIEAVDADLVVVGRQEAVRSVDLARRLLALAPCDTILLRPVDGGGRSCKRILVPAAGGPHALVALKLAEKMLAGEEAELTALYVELDVGQDAEEVGRRQIGEALRRASVRASGWIEPRVQLARKVDQGIAEVAAEGYDLLLLGATDQGFIHRMLFGTIPEALLAGPHPLTVAVLRRSRPLVVQTRMALDRWFERRIPQLDRDRRVSLFEQLKDGSRWNFDFVALLCLSTAIASLGLMLNSAAVVIGAMLVAPLMTPMIAAGLGLVQGNPILARESVRTVVLGFFVALAIGVILGLVTPLQVPTEEMRARFAPNLLDLMVALLSGMAAAYATARPGLSEALPGVAIAAALVPPIATAGVSLSLGDMTGARGAAALFGTNLVAIVLGAAMTLYCIGCRGKKGKSSVRLWASRALLGLLLTAAVISIPLGSVLFSSGQSSEVSSELRAALAEVVEKEQGALVSVALRRDDRGAALDVVVSASEPATTRQARTLAEIAGRTLGRQVRVEVTTRLVARSKPPPG